MKLLSRKDNLHAVLDSLDEGKKVSSSPSTTSESPVPDRAMTAYAMMAIVASCLGGMTFGLDINSVAWQSVDGYRDTMGWPRLAPGGTDPTWVADKTGYDIHITAFLFGIIYLLDSMSSLFDLSPSLFFFLLLLLLSFLYALSLCASATLLYIYTCFINHSWVVAIFHLSAMLSAPFAGAFADRYGRRTAIVGGGFLFIAGAIIQVRFMFPHIRAFFSF